MSNGAQLAILIGLATVLASARPPGMQDWEEGLNLYASEQYTQARKSFERALSLDPTNSTYTLWLGRALGRRAERMSGLRRLGAFSLAKRVRQLFEQAIELDRTNVEALESLHRFHLEAPGLVGGDKTQARDLASKIERFDAARGARAWAAYDESLGDLDSAGEKYALAQTLDSEDTGHLLSHAAFLARCGLHTESDALFEEAFARDPGNPEVWLAAGKAWIQVRRQSLYARARQLLERYLASPDRNPDSDPASEVRKLLRTL